MTESKEQTTPQTVDEAYPEADKVLQAIMAQGDPVQDPVVEAEVEETEAPSAAVETAEPPVETAPDESAKARTNLKLYAQVPDAVLEALDPSQATAWWSGLAEKKASEDRNYQENAALNKRLEALEATPATEPAKPTVNVDLVEARQKLVDAVGEDETGAFDRYMELREKAIQSQVSPQMEQLQEAENQRTLDRALDGLGIAQLSDPGMRERVLARASGLHGDNDAILSALLREAVRREIPDLPTPEQERADKEAATARRVGSPTAKASKPKTTTPRTDEEKLTEALRLIVEEGVTDPAVVRQKAWGTS